MQLHKYEKIWLSFGIASLVFFLLLLGYGAFYKGTHPQSHAETIDPNHVEANVSFQPEHLGLNKIAENRYVVNIVASTFNYDFGKDENGNPVKNIRIPKGSNVLFQVTTKDVVHGFNAAGTNVNMIVEPGYVSSYETVLDKPGVYTILCNEYCGLGHHMMYATLEVYE
ncbi:cytochrome c oxidase subunit II [Virgibacillus sp. 179-BFC.A HS]|uniref:Cytochrome aa3 subunit 2 n=1 Tax=Tigheibacillus jepli TaxID=3035914 RepID=A0ABU5CIU4_9BACI|nr:cytochrome c oxidase subunit II [Virgibacillus sp. 179-BFC.A HS]MDY0405734.1 cytochrome c oxidase subunit II [Virgibacillus sp. 179-BFC.A HS]